MRFKAVFLTLWGLIWALSVHSTVAWADLRLLLDKPSRPTVSEFIQELGIPENDPIDRQIDVVHLFYKNFADVNPLQLVENQPIYIAKLIAQCEKAFPGATFAFLGRDSAFLADAFAAFYTQIGQPERVVLLNASGTSIDNATPEMLVKFLQFNGLPKDDLDSAHPFVMLDATRNNPESQSRRLMAAAYSYFTEKGVPPPQLVRKIGFINTTTKNDMYAARHRLYLADGLDIDEFYNDEEVVATSTTGPDELLTVEATNIGYALEWHEPFGVLREDPNTGKVFALPGTLKNINDRKVIIHETWGLLRLTGTPAFLDLVKEEAKKLGYEFPLQRPDPAPLKTTIPGLTYKSPLERQALRLKYVVEKKNFIERDKYVSRIFGDLLKEVNQDPIQLVHVLSSAGALGIFAKIEDGQITKNLNFAQMVPKLLNNGLSMHDVQILISGVCSKNGEAYKQALTTALQGVKTAQDFLDLAVIPPNMPVKNEQHLILSFVMDNLNRFFELKPNMQQVDALHDRFSPAGVDIKGVFWGSFKGLDSLISYSQQSLDGPGIRHLSSQEQSERRARVRSILAACMRLRPSPEQVTKLNEMLTRALWPLPLNYEAAVLEIPDVKSMAEFMKLVNSLPEQERASFVQTYFPVLNMDFRENEASLNMEAIKDLQKLLSSDLKGVHSLWRGALVSPHVIRDSKDFMRLLEPTNADQTSLRLFYFDHEKDFLDAVARVDLSDDDFQVLLGRLKFTNQTPLLSIASAMTHSKSFTAKRFINLTKVIQKAAGLAAAKQFAKENAGRFVQLSSDFREYLELEKIAGPFTDEKIMWALFSKVRNSEDLTEFLMVFGEAGFKCLEYRWEKAVATLKSLRMTDEQFNQILSSRPISDDFTVHGEKAADAFEIYLASHDYAPQAIADGARLVGGKMHVDSLEKVYFLRRMRQRIQHKHLSMASWLDVLEAVEPTLNWPYNRFHSSKLTFDESITMLWETMTASDFSRLVKMINKIGNASRLKFEFPFLSNKITYHHQFLVANPTAEGLEAVFSAKLLRFSDKKLILNEILPLLSADEMAKLHLPAGFWGRLAISNKMSREWEKRLKPESKGEFRLSCQVTMKTLSFIMRGRSK